MPTSTQLRDLEAALVWGSWPGRSANVNRQNIAPLVRPDVVRSIAPDEATLILMPPPFHSLRDEKMGNSEFWDEFGALDEINPDEAVIVADFSVGSDAVVVVDFAGATTPRVLRLQWQVGGNHWVEISPTVHAFRLALEID